MATGLRPFDRRLLTQVRSVRWMFAADVASGFVGTVLLLAQVTLIADVLASVTTGEWRSVPTDVLVALVVIIALRAAMAQLVEVTGRRTATTVMSTLRRRLVAGHLARGGRAQPGAGSGTSIDAAELATAAVQGVDGLETYFARYLPQLVLAVTVPAAVVVWSAFVDPESALIMVITLPLIPIFMILIGRSAAARSEANWLALVALSAHFLDVVRGLPTLRAFNRGEAQIPKIRATTEQYRRTTMSTLRLAFLSGFVLDLATTLSTALVAVTLGVRLVDGSVGLRPALTVLLLVPELYAPIRAVGTLFHASTDGLAAASQILDLAALETVDPIEPRVAVEPVEPFGPFDLGRRDIEIRHLTVRFDGRPAPALDAVTLTIAPLELLAVVGPSGAGKTTLGRVLLGLHRPDAGTIRIGDRDLAHADLDAWRHELAWAPQQPTLVHGSVADNIDLARRGDRDRVQRAAVQAGADTFIRALPDGYDTIIGDGGRGLSAGQRQRLGLARALARDAALVVLDEPTAHLDPRSIEIVTATIDALRGTRTIVLITHDLVLAQHADRSVTIEGGHLHPGTPLAKAAR